MSKPFHQIIKENFQIPGFPSHMTHLENFENILISGELKSYNLMRGRQYVNLANDDVQAGRSKIVVSVTGKNLHDYVPLYFGPKTPMVVKNQKINDELLFLRLPLSILKMAGAVFTDGNARDGTTQFYLFKSIDDLRVLNAHALHSTTWKNETLEFKRQKQAEILIPDRLKIDQAYDIVCYSGDVKLRVEQLLKKYDIKKTVLTSRSYYFVPSKK